MSSQSKVLAVDDNEDGLFALEQALQANGFTTVTAKNGKEALQRVEAEHPDLILLDVNMPELDGYEVTKRLKSDPWLRYIPVVLVTANDNPEDVIRGLELGADDYIKRPFQTDELIARVRAAVRTRRTYQELQKSNRLNEELQQKLAQRTTYGSIVGSSQIMQELFGLLDKVKDSDVPVLISGESGTGKELVASALHYQGPRRNKPFVIQNCSAFNDNLLESELFGHVRGAFTGAVRDKQGLFEMADGGSFFLDELGEMTPALQVKLLRVLQDGTFTPVGATKLRKVDVRVIAATNRNLQDMVRAGTFREDLFYRLNVVRIHMPPLRERRSDIPLLAAHFLCGISKRSGKSQKTCSADALRYLCEYSWPGNIRELQNELERLALMAGEQSEISAQEVSLHMRVSQTSSGAVAGNLKQATQDLEKRMIIQALENCAWNKSDAAKQLGISRSNLISKVKEFELEQN